VYDFRDKASYWPKIAIFSYPSAFPRLNIAVSFGTEKLEWCGYPTVKNFEEKCTRFDRIHERDAQTTRTDRHHATAWEAPMHSIAWQKPCLRYVIVTTNG